MRPENPQELQPGALFPVSAPARFMRYVYRQARTLSLCPGYLQRTGLGPSALYATARGLSRQFLRTESWDHPTRWIDQGAVQALPLYEVSNRLQSGLIEVALKSAVNDRTDWRRMLRGGQPELDLSVERDRVLAAASDQLTTCIAGLETDSVKVLGDAQETRFCYPVLRDPEKIKALNFDKQGRIEGVLEGIRGQYLILDCGVLNIRKFSGYELSVSLP